MWILVRNYRCLVWFVYFFLQTFLKSIFYTSFCFCVGLCPISFCQSFICAQAAAALSNIHDQQWEVLYQERVWTWQSWDFPLFLGPQRQDALQQNISSNRKAPAFVRTKWMQPMHLYAPLLNLSSFYFGFLSVFREKQCYERVFSFLLFFPTYSEIKSVVWQQYSWVHISHESKVSLMSTYVNPLLYSSFFKSSLQMCSQPSSSPEFHCSTSQSISSQVSRAEWALACGPLSQGFGAPTATQREYPWRQGEGQGNHVWQLYTQGLLVTRGPSKGLNYTALDSTTPRFHPPKPLGCCFPGEEGVFAGESRRGEAGPGTKDGSLASTVLHDSGCILLPFFCLFFSSG